MISWHVLKNTICFPKQWKWWWIMDSVFAGLILKHSQISWVASHGMALIIFSAALMFVTVTAVTGVPHWCSPLKLPALCKFTKPEKDIGVMSAPFKLTYFSAERSCQIASNSKRTSFNMSAYYTHTVIESPDSSWQLHLPLQTLNVWG